MAKKTVAAAEGEILQELSRVRAIVRHKQNVLDACLLLGEKLMETGEVDLGRQLIANGFEHDLSKFHGIEYDYLSLEHDDKDKVALAVDNHNRTNSHHPESWGPNGIKLMPRIYVAEMVCDWKARSGEQEGGGLRDWIEKEARKRFNFTKRDAVYQEIMTFVDMLLNKKFEQLPEVAKE